MHEQQLTKEKADEFVFVEDGLGLDSLARPPAPWCKQSLE